MGDAEGDAMMHWAKLHVDGWSHRAPGASPLENAQNSRARPKQERALLEELGLAMIGEA